ncbi:MAG: hypothetical protein B7Z55_09515 [Planctomycetales bacterium 12-60-4]|nr:MAG: hypothetical protein B7Z55_09515 [Planctomycetales bacterium 12-60-4]
MVASPTTTETPRLFLRLRNDVRLLIAEKHWEGCNGLTVTDEMRVTIAAHAAYMCLGFPELPFDRLVTILIYPDTFVATPRRRQPWGLEEDVAEARLGEAWYQGPVILSWRQIVSQCVERPDGRNLVIHEFSHLLDMANYDVDGIPDLPFDSNPQQWADIFRDEFQRLQRQLRLGRATVLDAYAGTSPVEFFAVGSEAFFEKPVALKTESPRVYDILRRYYHQNPAAGQASRAETVD